jgi:hypothetical protein
MNDNSSRNHWRMHAKPAGTAVRRDRRGDGIQFRTVLADGTVIKAARAAFTLCSAVRAQRRVALFNVGLLEAYFDGGLDIEGDIASRSGPDSTAATTSSGIR